MTWEEEKKQYNKFVIEYLEQQLEHGYLEKKECIKAKSHSWEITQMMMLYFEDLESFGFEITLTDELLVLDTFISEVLKK